MLLVKTTIKKIFDEVDSEHSIKDKLEAVLSNDDYKTFMEPFWSQGKILKRSTKFEQDEINWHYSSVVVYPDWETYLEIFDCFDNQDFLKKLFVAGFEVDVKLKELAKPLASMI